MNTDQKIPVFTPRRDPVHRSITRRQIDELVENFYSKVRDNERLGGIFDVRIMALNNGDWEPHLEKMKKFWASVLLKTGEYKGQPVVVHNNLPDLQETDFAIWLDLFTSTVNEVMDADARPLVIESARRIAQSLYLARFGDADTVPPF